MPRWKLFEFRGHRVFLEPLFLLLIAIFVFGQVTSANQLLYNLAWIPVLFVGVLWHEFGHAFAIKYFGYGSSQIVLQGLGGVTINKQRRDSPNKAMAISFAGPLFSFSLTLVFGLSLFAFPSSEGWLYHLCYLMALANGFWGVFNLVPIAPLDGGHIVQHALRKKFPRRKALLYSAYSSMVFLVLLIIPAFKFLSPFFAILLALLFGLHNWRVIQALKG